MPMKKALVEDKIFKSTGRWPVDLQKLHYSTDPLLENLGSFMTTLSKNTFVELLLVFSRFKQFT